MIREGAGNTENQDFKLRNTEGNTDIYFIGTSERVPTGKASIFSRMPKILCAQTMAIFTFDFYMIRIPSPYTLLRLIKPYTYSSIVN